jgi:hypothetical protein
MGCYFLMRQIEDASNSDEVTLQRKFGNEQYVLSNFRCKKFDQKKY